MSEVDENATVSFSVKEMLQEQTSILRGIDTKVDGKADKSDLAPIVSEVQRAHGRLQVIEDERKSEKAVGESRSATRRRMAWAIGFVMVPITTTCIVVFH